MANCFENLVFETESDVEQKFIYKLLTTSTPDGLGFSDIDFKTKRDIRKILIGKGKAKKIYYPDYIVLLKGVPSLIIEAKAPREDLTEASREARLYAAEINSGYPVNINPCKYFIVTNGNDLILGNWDCQEPIVDCDVNKDINPVNLKFSKITELISKGVMLNYSDQILKEIRKGALFFKPIYMLGGKAVKNQTIGENSFGANISLEYKYLFNPEALEDREKIVQNAYVESKRRQSHVSPIDRIIRAAIPPSQINSREIKSTSNPSELIAEISDQRKIKKELCLLIGSVGSGKSTFTDYLRTVALPLELRQKTQWVNINLNVAPVSKDQIYGWIAREVINSLKNAHKKIDFDALPTIKSIYKSKLDKVKKGRAALYSKGSANYTRIIESELRELQNNSEETLEALIEFLCTSRCKSLMVVLDNCDRRKRDDQLLMFEVASWLKTRFNCSIFLPLRDSTYDQHCDSPPLDTVIKDLVFRIDPPLLKNVIYKRLNFALRENGINKKKFSYSLVNGIKVQCDRAEVDTYLQCIVSSLFQDNFLKRIITGLAGRNIRKGIEIILEFCKSGHLSEDEILTIRNSRGDFKLTNAVIVKILLRRKRLYYDDGHSFIKNLFDSDKEDSLPNPFVRIYILLWLKKMFREHGPNKTKGYHRVADLLNALQAFGHSEDRVLIELERLSRAGCVVSESLDHLIAIDDLVSIAPPGFIHLDLLRNINYLGTVAEDTYFRENQIAKKIKDNFIGESIHTPFSFPSFLSSSKALVNYMNDYYKTYFSNYTCILNLDDKRGINFIETIKNHVDSVAKNNPRALRTEYIIEDYPPGTHVDCLVLSIKPYGLFVNFGIYGNGMIHISEFKDLSSEYIECFEVGDWVKAEVLNYSKKHSGFNLRLVDF